MTLLLSNEDVERALTHQDALSATEAILGELANGQAINRPRSQTYMPVESKEHPGFRYRFKSQEGGGVGSGVWALRITSDMAGFSYTAGVKRRRILPVASGNRWCGLVILFDLERLEPVAIMPDGVIQKMRVAAMSAVGAKKSRGFSDYSAAAGRRALTCNRCAACFLSSASKCTARTRSIAASSAAR
jgi:ornithine cyclodeaminase/alanine dehydrogenase-like protein (mu-crystallin family)